MNILSLSRTEVIELINSGMLRKENLKHYDICKALSEGKKQNEVAAQFDVPDLRHVRYVKEKKCPNCR